MAQGTTRVRGLLEGDDIMRTASAMRALGADIERDGDEWLVTGAKWQSPEQALYFGNAGTGVRLVMGAVAGAGVEASFDGDQSLRGRPMGRIIDPLGEMGASATSRDGLLPVTFAQNDGLTGIEYTLPKPSAQIKSAVLLAALGAKGKTVVHEPILSRDHTERMLGAFGAELEITPDHKGGRYIAIEGGQKLKASDVHVPGDPSSAAFLVVAGLLVPGADVLVKNVLLNPQRIGLYSTLMEMGADLTFENEREQSGEPVADIRAKYSKLKGIEVPVERAPSMIDEYPILAVAAAFAQGETIMEGLEELRIKESDRLAAVEAGLKDAGVDVRTGESWMRVNATGAAPKAAPW